MRTLQNNWWIRIISIALVLGVAATLGGVGQSRAGALNAAAVPGVTAAGESFFDIFLEIDGIEGESTAPAHKGSIEVLSWSWGVSQTATGGGGGAGGAVGRELKGHVTLIKRIDKSTPLLFQRCANGTHIPRATVHLARADGQTFLKYELKEVMVSSISHGGDVDGDGMPDETLTLELGGTKLTYTQFDATGKPVGQTTGEW